AAWRWYGSADAGGFPSRRTGSGRASLVRAAQLAVVPAHGAGGDEAQPNAFLGLLADHRSDLGGEVTGIALEQPKPVGLDPLRFPLDLHVAFERDAAQLLILDALLDAHGRARIPLQV